MRLCVAGLVFPETLNTMVPSPSKDEGSKKNVKYGIIGGQTGIPHSPLLNSSREAEC